METTFLLRFGELTLKSAPVRKRMIRRLLSNLKDVLQRRGIPFRFERQWARAFVVTTEPEAMSKVLSQLFGILSFSVIHRFPSEGQEKLLAIAAPYFIPHVTGKTFAVRARRDPESPGYSTQQIERELGSLLFEHTAGVNLKHPDITCHVEVRGDEIYMYASKESGVGGLPIGVTESCLSLISGGFDSPVASWLSARRGVPCDFVFFELGGLTQRAPVYAHLQHLYQEWLFGYRPKLFIVPGKPILDALHKKVHPKFWNVMLKRIFYKVAERIAHRNRHTALITGEAISQVSSQTITNLRSLEHQLDIPVFRPLLTYDKREIVKLANTIGTNDISEGVKEYCAITPGNPSTAATTDKVLSFEEQLGGDEFYTSLLKDIEELRVHAIKPEQIQYLHILTDEVPKGAIWLDMREDPRPALSHPCQVISLEELVTEPEQLAKDQTYFLLCEVGMQSMEAAYMLQELGYHALAYEGGTERLRKKMPIGV